MTRFSSGNRYQFVWASFIAVLWSALAHTALADTARCPDPGVAVARSYPDQEIADLARASPEPNLLIGDSIAAFWPTTSMTHWIGGSTENLGYSGDTPSNVLWRLQQIKRPRHWRRIVLIAGVNAAWQDPVCHNVAAGIEAVVLALKRLSPSARVFVLPVMPFGPDLEKSFNENRPINHKLAADAGRLGYELVDTASAIAARCTDGSTCPLLRDSLHPSQAGYDAIGSALSTAMKAS